MGNQCKENIRQGVDKFDVHKKLIPFDKKNAKV